MAAIERILITVDDDTAATQLALSAGLAAAAAHGAEALVLGTVHDVERWSDSLADIFTREELAARYADHRRAQIERLVQSRDDDAKIRIEVAAGVPFVEIIRKAVAESVNLIVQGSPRPRGEQHEFSSQDWHLMRKSPVPVWIVRDAEYPPRHVAAAVDVVDTAAEAGELNRRILDLAGTIAVTTGAKLSVLSVWSLPAETMLRSSPFLRVSPARLDEAVARMQAGAAAAQGALRARLESRAPSPASVDWRLVKGQPRDAIPNFVHDEGADLLVMGTVGRTGIPGLLIGNTAETVLSRVSCSVLTLKPSPFVSPVA